MPDGATGAQERLAAIRRGLNDVTVQVADGVGRLFQDAPPGRLERLMKSPARRLVLDAIFWQMPKHLDRKRAVRSTIAVRWSLTGRRDGATDVYDLQVVDGRARVIRGGAATVPPITITLDGAEFVRLASGSFDPIRAYFTGRLAISGDIMAAAKLAGMFEMPGRRGERATGA